MATFVGYLDTSHIERLVEAAVSGDLLESRRQLLTGLPPAFSASLARADNPLDQFQSDLVRIGRVERLTDGQVPIVTFLHNAAFQLRLRSRPESSVFQAILSAVGNQSAGVPPLPDPALLPEVVTNEQIVGEDDSITVGFLAAGVEMAKAVARISVPRFDKGTQMMVTGGPWILRGTAWIVGPGLVLTNHHVINARRTEEGAASDADLRRQALGATLEFGFDADGATCVPATVTDLPASSAALDYALLRVAGAPDVSIPRLQPALVVLTRTSRMAVNIIGHPRGEPKKVALRNNLVAAADAETLRYYTDTDYGSSGSPVCDDRWRVVALHRGTRNAPGANYQGKSEAYVNFGSQIQAVLADIRNGAPDAAAVITRAQPGA